MHNQHTIQSQTLIQPDNLSPYAVAGPLAPAPLRMPVAAPASLRAADGTAAFQILLADDGTQGGRVVFDDTGACVELLLFIGVERTRADMQALAVFAERRRVAGNRVFADADFAQAIVDAGEAPEGPPGHVFVHYVNAPAAPDGTRTVLVAANEELHSTLAVNVDGDIVDGVRHLKEPTPYAKELRRAFAARRLSAADAWFMNLRTKARENGDLR